MKVFDFSAALLVAGVFSLLFLVYLRTPEVYLSHSTKECVKVVPTEAGTCDALPPRYEVVWVR